MSIAAACFSIYAFEELKKELKDVDELRFIFTSPSFTTEKETKSQREFYIPRLNRERGLYGTEFEVKLRNELTQKAIAKECADWIRKKVTFKSNFTNENMMGFINVNDKNYMPINGFTTVDLGCERGNNAYSMIQKTDMPFSKAYMDLFEDLWIDQNRLQDVTDIVLDNITVAYKENAPEFIYFIALYNIFNEFLEDISEDVLPNEATGFKQSRIWNMLYNFQRDAVLAIINKLEQYNGCILADSVGLGKTFTALAVIKYKEFCNMELGMIFNTYFKKYCAVSNIIDMYNSVSDGKYTFETLELHNVFSLGLFPDPDIPSGIFFDASIYISRDIPFETETIDLKISFSQFQKKYAGNNFCDDEDGDDILIKSIADKLIDKIDIRSIERQTATIFFDKPLTFKVKESNNENTAEYYIIGAKLEKD